jgi:small subunit ribosomal protein S8
MTLYRMLANIKNALIAKRPFLIHDGSKKCERILEILWKEGYISGYRKTQEKQKQRIKIFLKYHRGNSTIQVISAFSRPGKRVYLTKAQLWKINSRDSFLVISTNKGFKTLSDCKRDKIGGEPLIFIQ